MWYGHIRDLFPTAEGCMGSRTTNVTLLHWAQQEECYGVMSVNLLGLRRGWCGRLVLGQGAKVLSGVAQGICPPHPGR